MRVNRIRMCIRVAIIGITAIARWSRVRIVAWNMIAAMTCGRMSYSLVGIVVCNIETVMPILVVQQIGTGGLLTHTLLSKQAGIGPVSAIMSHRSRHLVGRV